MRHKQLKITLTLLLGLGVPMLYAQNSINASSGQISGSTGEISFSVGQVFYNTNIGATCYESQGIQQPFDITVITSLGGFEHINLSVFPNPTANYLHLIIEDADKTQYTYQLYSTNGTVIQNEKVFETVTTINMCSFVSAIYFMKVFNKNKLIKTFKIIKN